MKFAMVNNRRIEAYKGGTGACPLCEGPVIARCGDQRAHHWAHKKGRLCDRWWEPETEWHRHWKNQFPESWQEVIIPDARTGEKHIADVRTDNGLVVEFQHSFLKAEERTSREAHYKDMVWVVDGTRLKRDYPRFLRGKRHFRKTDDEGIFKVEYLEEVFPANWINCDVPCLFDFMGLDKEMEARMGQKLLCILPEKDGRFHWIAEVTKKAFVKAVKNGDWSIRIKKFIERIKPVHQPEVELSSPVRTIPSQPSILPFRRRVYYRREYLLDKAIRDMNRKASKKNGRRPRSK